jgi:hypothetical protein
VYFSAKHASAKYASVKNDLVFGMYAYVRYICRYDSASYDSVRYAYCIIQKS